MRAQIQIYRNPKGVHTLRVCDSADELTAQTLGSLREWVNDHIKEHGEDADFCLTTRDGDSAEYYIERPATEANLPKLPMEEVPSSPEPQSGAPPAAPTVVSSTNGSKAKPKLFMTYVRHLCQWLIDWVWPVLERRPEQEEQREREKRTSKLNDAKIRAKAITEETNIETALDNCQELLDADVARRTSVETRLSSVVGLTSVAAALTLGILTSQLGKSFEIPNSGWLKSTSVLVLYCVVQLVAALLAALKGLTRRNGLATDTDDALPQADEPKLEHLRRRLLARLDCIDDHEDGTRYKVEYMAVAHEALKNFFFGVLGLVLVLTAVALFAPDGGDVR